MYEKNAVADMEKNINIKLTKDTHTGKHRPPRIGWTEEKWETIVQFRGFLILIRDKKINQIYISEFNDAKSDLILVQFNLNIIFRSITIITYSFSLF